MFFNKPYIKITFIYILISSLWIFFSDKILFLTFKSPEFITRIQTFKGSIFVIFTGGIIFWLIRNYFLKVQEQNLKIESLSKSKDFFLKNITHELKTPLNGITLINELLKDEDLLNKNELTYELGRCASELNYLISNVIEISEIQSHILEYKENKFNLSYFVWGIGMLYYLAARRNGVDFGIYIDPDIPEYVFSDEKKLKKILVNLLENSIKFTKKGHILLETLYDRESETVTFKISDTGVGFKKDESELYSSFFSQDYDINKSFNGIGAGLIISKQYSDFLGGKLSYSSSPKNGAVFSLNIKFNNFLLRKEENFDFSPKKIIIISKFEANATVLQKILENHNCMVYNYSFAVNLDSLAGFGYTFILDYDAPYSIFSFIKEFVAKDNSSNFVLIEEYFSLEKETPSILIPINSDAVLATIFKKKPKSVITVLIADDNELNREVLSSIVEKEVNNIVVAKTGYSAVELWRKYTPDIIFLDINLPDLSGYEVARKIRNEEHGKRSCIIAVTAYKIDQVKLREHGFDLFIEKPFKLEKVYKTLLEEIHLRSQ